MAQAPTSPGGSSGLLASCKGIVYVLKNQKWDPVFGNSVYRFHLVRQSPGNFVLFIVHDQPNILVRPCSCLNNVFVPQQCICLCHQSFTFYPQEYRPVHTILYDSILSHTTCFKHMY